MATKKAQTKSAPAASNDDSMGTIWKWLYVIGILAASVAGAVGFQHSILTIVFAVLGLLVGLFFFDSSDVVNFGLRYLIVTTAAVSLDVLPVVGPYISGFFTAFAAFLGPIVLGMVIMSFWKKYFGSM